MAFSPLYYATHAARYLVASSTRLFTNRRAENQKQVKKNEADIIERLEFEMDLYADRASFDETENDSYDTTLVERLEDFIYRDLTHLVFISNSFIREILLQKDEKIDTDEARLKKLDDLKKNLLVIYRRANRFVFPIVSDPEFLLSVEESFVQPEICILGQGGKESIEKEEVSYCEILNCLESDKSIRRILISGEFGSGKNTVCSKLILDIVNRKFLFLEKEYKLYIWCDLNKFQDWNIKTLDEILIRFCHCYSTIIRIEETKALLNAFKENILCIFTGYEYLPPYAREKVNFLLNKDNKENTIFGYATIVIATTADQHIGPTFKKFFEKHFSLRRIKLETAEKLLLKLFHEDNADEKDMFLKYLKKTDLLFLLELSPLIVIFSCYVYKTYERKDGHQFVVELVNLLRECKKDKRIFRSREAFVEKELLRNEWVGRRYGPKFSVFDPKAYDCYTYLTGKRLRLLDTFDRSSSFVQRSLVYNLRSVNFEQNVKLYDQQVLAMNSLHKLFHGIHNLRHHINWFLQFFAYYYIKIESERKIVEIPFDEFTPESRFDKLRIRIIRSLLINVFKQQYNIDYYFLSLLLSELFQRFNECKVTWVARMFVRVPHTSNVNHSPILFVVTLFVFQNCEDALGVSEIIDNVSCYLFNCVNFQNVKFQNENYNTLVSKKTKIFSDIRQNKRIKPNQCVENYKNIKAGLLAFLYDIVKFEKRLNEIVNHKMEMDQSDYEKMKNNSFVSNSRDAILGDELQEISQEIILTQNCCAAFLKSRKLEFGKSLMQLVENVLSRLIEVLHDTMEDLIKRRHIFSSQKHRYWDLREFKVPILRYENMLALQEDKIRNWSFQFEDSLNTLFENNVSESDTTPASILSENIINPVELISKRFCGVLESLRLILEKY